MFRSLRHKLLFWFHGFITLNLIIIGLSVAYFQSREAIDLNTKIIAETRAFLLEDYKIQANFFSQETKSSFFFEYKVSQYLDQHQSLLDSIKNNLTLLKNDEITSRFGLQKEINSMISRLSLYDGTFNQMVQLILKRGYKEHGLVGQMRKKAHDIEEYPDINAVAYLSMRRYEKDYFIRFENIYLRKVYELVERVRKDILNSNKMDDQQKSRALSDLESYHQIFTQVVRLDKKLGIFNNTGLKKDLDQDAEILTNEFFDFQQKANFQKEENNRNLKTFFLGFGAVLILIGFLASFVLAKLITDPLSKLSKYINKFVKSDFSYDQHMAVDKKKDEVGRLTQNFMVMKDKILEQLKYFRLKVQERTVELAEANERLTRVNEANSRFVPQEFLNYLGRKSILDIKLGDHVEKDMTILFSDIRNFTRHSESLSPQQNFDFINSYLKTTAPLVKKHGGFIDKYIGDSMMALFPEDPDHAIQTAIESIGAVDLYNKEHKEELKEPIVVGIGIHSGHLILGTIGAEKRMETTVISDAVNIASRMEGLTKLYQSPIIVTGSLIRKLANPELFNFRKIDMVKAKGKQNISEIYEVLDGISDPRQFDLKLQTREQYEKALILYRNKEINESIAIFKDIAAINPMDIAAQIFLKRCGGLIKDGIPDNFDGAEKMFSK